MSNPDPATAKPAREHEDPQSSGPNLMLIYSLLGLAILIAMIVAAFIVLPFYQHR